MRTCKANGCRKRYEISRFDPPFRTWCSVDCAIKISAARKKHSEKLEERDRRRRDRVTKERLKTRSEWIVEAQRAFNSYIRARDYGNGCISCGGRPERRYGGTMDAGHYRSTGSAPHMRYVPTNCYAQCVKCNRDLSGNSVEYRKSLGNRLGEDRVLALEHDQTLRKFTIDDLKRIKALYTRKAKHYKALRGE